MLWIVREKTLESLLGSKEIKPVHPKGNQSWIFIGRTDAKAEAPVLRPPDAKSLTHWKRPWCWEVLKAKDEEGGRGWDGWMASLTWWTWVWATFRRMLRIDGPGFLLQAHRVAERHMWLSDWTTANVHAARVEGTQAGWAESTVVSAISGEPGFRVLLKQLRSTHSLLICLLYWTLSPAAGCPERSWQPGIIWHTE